VLVVFTQASTDTAVSLGSASTVVMRGVLPPADVIAASVSPCSAPGARA
jgi:hypothetical protein